MESTDIIGRPHCSAQQPHCAIVVGQNVTSEGDTYILYACWLLVVKIYDLLFFFSHKVLLYSSSIKESWQPPKNVTETEEWNLDLQSS